jgi:hypothetical protein
MASFHGSVSASRNGGKKASHGCRTRPEGTAGTCRSVNEVYNAGHGIWLMLIWRQQVALGEDVGRQLINFDIETLRSKGNSSIAITCGLHILHQSAVLRNI